MTKREEYSNMKNTKCKVISEFEGKINGITIKDPDTYYMLEWAFDVITDKLRQIKLAKEKLFINDVLVGLLGLKMIDQIPPHDIAISVAKALALFKNNNFKTFKLVIPTDKISKKIITINMGLVTERIKSGYYMR